MRGAYLAQDTSSLHQSVEGEKGPGEIILAELKWLFLLETNLLGDVYMESSGPVIALHISITNLYFYTVKICQVFHVKTRRLQAFTRATKITLA